MEWKGVMGMNCQIFLLQLNVIWYHTHKYTPMHNVAEPAQCKKGKVKFGEIEHIFVSILKSVYTYYIYWYAQVNVYFDSNFYDEMINYSMLCFRHVFLVSYHYWITCMDRQTLYDQAVV